MREIRIKINKETLKASIDMDGYEGQECVTDFQEIMRALEATPEVVVDKVSGTVSVGNITISR